MSGNQNKTDKNDESSGSEQQFGGTESTTSIQDKAWQNQRNEEKEKAESIISHDTVLKNDGNSSFNQLGIADTTNDHIYNSRKNEKDKQKATISGSSNKWSTKPFSTYKRILILDYHSILNHFNNLQGDEEPEEQQTPITENEQNKIMLQFFQQAQKFYAKGVEPKESRLVDFPVFKGGNQDSVEWIEAFSRACIANRKHQLRNRKQKQGETIEEYIAAITELWKRVDLTDRRMELDKIHEFIEGLRPEFVVPVQSAMPQTVEEAMEKAQALETAFSMGMDLSVYLMMPGYLQNMNGGMIPA
ncbi:unnamed protein product [Rhizophagus irregularis]|nr:unnamed protein product [Rhizophagus irregularis]